MPVPSAPPAGARAHAPADLGVTVEATYAVGEYDIAILSAKQSNGLTIYLTENGYRLPPGAGPVLASYIRQGMHFFIAKVNLDRRSELGFTFLRPLQVAYESKKFMLPIRLGTVNADGPQELFVFVLTRNGRVETANYRNVKIPSDAEVPLFTKAEFKPFYKAMFDTAVKREDMRAVFLEYAWDMTWCDPCAAEPLSAAELRDLGAFWVAGGSGRGGGVEAFVTRLHVRYDADHFPEDLALTETRDRDNFQGRYILRHPFTGPAACDEGRNYRRSLVERFGREAETLARLTGWPIAEIREKMAKGGQPLPTDGGDQGPWWQNLWQKP